MVKYRSRVGEEARGDGYIEVEREEVARGDGCIEVEQEWVVFKKMLI